MKKGTRISTKVIKELLLDGVWYDLKGMTEPDDGVSGTSISVENPKRRTMMKKG
jgi:hypothetical protein